MKKTRPIVRAIFALGVLPIWMFAGCSGGSGGPAPLARETGGPVGGSVTNELVSATPTPTVPPLSSPIPLLEGHQIGITRWGNRDTNNGGLGQPIGDMTCGGMVVTYHIHAHLSFFVDGQQLAIPMTIGITNPEIIYPAKWPDGYVSGTYNGCHYPLHTHDTSGKIHIEGSQPKPYTLGQFFAIWGRSLSWTDVANYTGKPIVVYIHDPGLPAFRYSGAIKDIALLKRREITIQIGSTLRQIPTYQWYVPQPTPTPTGTTTASSITGARAGHGEENGVDF